MRRKPPKGELMKENFYILFPVAGGRCGQGNGHNRLRKHIK